MDMLVPVRLYLVDRGAIMYEGVRVLAPHESVFTQTIHVELVDLVEALSCSIAY
jgi:hypothetical protein